MRPFITLVVVLIIATSPPEPSQAQPTPVGQTPLAALSFLVGDWQATGAGEPGPSAGQFSFDWAADHHALIRKNEAVTPSGRHADVMLIYSHPDGEVRAVYADNEDHTIEYLVTILLDRQRVVFESGGAGPRFRLWYELARDGALATGFQVAPPGSAEFKTYLEGVARHKQLTPE